MSNPPSKNERELCWKSRDDYWKCLDDSNENLEKCKVQREFFLKCCSKQWVKHFDRRREYLKFKAKLDSGEDIKDFLAKSKEGKS